MVFKCDHKFKKITKKASSVCKAGPSCPRYCSNTTTPSSFSIIVIWQENTSGLSKLKPSNEQINNFSVLLNQT